MNKNYKNLNSYEEFKEFINSNKITTRFNFRKQFPGAEYRFRNLLSEEDQEKLLPSKKYKYDLETLDKFKKFIIDNKITSRIYLYDNYRGAYGLFQKLSKEDQDIILPSSYPNYSDLISYDDFESFIKENNILSRREFRLRFSKCYERFRKLLSKTDQDNLLPSKYPYYGDLNYFDDFKNFIENNNIKDKGDFLNRFPGGFNRFCSFLTKLERKELLPIDNHHSTGELFLMNLFEKHKISFEIEKTFPKLKHKGLLRYDFYLPKYNTLVEYHGEQHFGEGYYFSEDLIYRDRLKYAYAITNNIPIYYYTNSIDSYSSNGYFTEVITCSNILIEKITGINLTN